jgi:hypothetical protein
MAREAKNFGLFTYVDNNSVDWNKRGEVDAVRNAVDGSTAATGAPVWHEGPRQRSRKVVYQDPTTFRTKTVVFYTASTWAAITLRSSTLSFYIEGDATAVVYTAVDKIGEKQAGQRYPNNLPEHA